MGNVIEIIQILGKPTVFVVKCAGQGVYYVVTSVGDVVGESIKTVELISEYRVFYYFFTILNIVEIFDSPENIKK